MLDNFMTWGQDYGLYVTIIILIIMYAMSAVENKRLRKELDDIRAEEKKFK